MGSRSRGTERAAAGVEAPPVRRGRPRSQDVRRNILAATDALLAERGFKATTMEAIAERAGASKVTLYRWWPNKAAVVMDAFFTRRSPRIPPTRSASVVYQVGAHMRAFARLMGGGTGPLLRALVAEGVFDPLASEAFRERWVEPRRAELRAILQAGIDRGELAAALDIETVTDALFGPLYHRLLIGHRPLTVEFADRLCSLVLRGVAA